MFPFLHSARMTQKILYTFPKGLGFSKFIAESEPLIRVSLYRKGQVFSPYPWTGKNSRCYTSEMLASVLYIYLSGFSLFLLGFSVFMYFENRKFDDNQFTVKLLPPPRPASFGMEANGNEASMNRPEIDNADKQMSPLMPLQATALA